MLHIFYQDWGTVHNRQQNQGLDSKGDISISEELLFIDMNDKEWWSFFFLWALDEVEGT